DHLYIHFVLDQWTLVEPGLYQADALSELAPLVASLAESLPARSEPPTPPAGRTLTRAAALALLAVASLPEQVVTPGHLHPSVARAIREIDANLAAPLPAPELAARSGCGERTLRRRFLESTGLTPGAYAQNRRIEQACILLHFSDASVDEIATRTGFCDRYHFTRAFSRARGMGPASFRKMVVAV
ncbi:MAG: helix-turn-helix domain-containing protein, partial [Spirochaetota bacterium]